MHSEAEDTKKAVQKAKETVVATTKTAVRTGKKVGSLAKEKAEKTAKVVVDTVQSEDTKKAVQKARRL